MTVPARSLPTRRALRRWIATGVVLCSVALAGCLPTIRVEPLQGSFSADPLPPEELRTRFEVRLFASEFADRIEIAADRIAAATDDPGERSAALRWKLGAASAGLRAGLRQAAQLALVDTWALARQGAALVESGEAARAFGAGQSIAIATARALAAEADALAERLLDPQALAAYRPLVDDYVTRHPLTDLGFARPSIANAWLPVAVRVGGVPKTLGAASEVLADATDRGNAWVQRAPDLVRWRTELALRDQTDGLAAFNRSVASMDRELAALGALAREQPDLARVALERLREDVGQALAATDRRWLDTLAMLRAERVAVGHALEETRIVIDGAIERERAALAEAFDLQRSKLSETFDAQRAALTADGERIAAELGRQWLGGLQGILRDVLVWVALVLFGLIGVGFGLGWASARVAVARRDARRDVAPPAG